MKHIVYFYSGTGNSFVVSKRVEKTGAEVRSIASEYRKMQDEQRNSIICEADKIGFIIPTYYLGLPRIVHDFMKALKIRNANYIYVIATMGWRVRGGIIRQMKDYMNEKGCHLSMGCYIQMPMNDFTLVKVDEPERQKMLLKKSEKAIPRIIKLVQDEKRHFDVEPLRLMVKKRNLPFCRESGNQDCKFSVTNECIGCGICSKMCSSGNIAMINKVPHWQHDCQMCLSCFHNCPKQAILYDGRGKEIPHYHHPEYSLSEMEKYNIFRAENQKPTIVN